MIAPAQQVAGGAHALRIDVGLRQHAAAQEHGDLSSIDTVVLGLAAVNRFHVQRVAEDEGDTFVSAQIGEPIPGEDALAGDDEVVAIRGHGREERFGRGLHVAVQQHFALRVEDTQIHRPGVQVDAAVVLMSLGVESHRGLLSRRLSDDCAQRGW